MLYWVCQFKNLDKFGYHGFKISDLQKQLEGAHGVNEYESEVKALT